MSAGANDAKRRNHEILLIFSSSHQNKNVFDKKKTQTNRSNFSMSSPVWCEPLNNEFSSSFNTTVYCKCMLLCLRIFHHLENRCMDWRGFPFLQFWPQSFWLCKGLYSIQMLWRSVKKKRNKKRFFCKRVFWFKIDFSASDYTWLARLNL